MTVSTILDQTSGAMFLVEVSQAIGKASRTAGLAATKLVKEGRLRYVGPPRGGRGEVLT